jgi:hypothetical protein
MDQVIRVISSLKKDGYLQTIGKKIKIVDVESFQNLISESNFFLEG